MAIQLQEFAKQVLFGTTIEEKLSFPREAIIDTKPGNAIATPRQLSRPAHLAVKEDGVRAKYPSEVKLIDAKERGRLLHFFGNHELLATELMALVLLKFPEAPASFRQGVLETLKEEQIHTRLYMHRMQQCGVEFGELPLSDYFWKSVSSMEDPLDYVTRLSLTFEQANLDYAREYGKIFASVGDTGTAKILDKIYHDEIDHVGFGLKWFRRWKASGKTDWEAFRERLVFPLSPARAKGRDFNRKGRLDAGLDPAFIQDLEIFQQSRGRTPSVLWFNPEAEHFAAQNADSPGPQRATSLQSDCAFLPAFLSRQDDILIMAKPPAPEFLQSIRSYGFHLPEILPSKPTSTGERAPELDRKIGDLRPWAWTPDSLSFFENTLPAVTRPIDPASRWHSGIRALFSKTWSAAWGKALARQTAQLDWVAQDDIYGRRVSDLAALRQTRQDFAATGYADIVCKAPFGTAANGLRCLLAGESIAPPLLQWLEQIISQQGSLIVEPWLERVFDFSVQFEMRPQGLKLVGYTRLENNRRGQFKGILTNAFCKGLSPELVRFLMERIEGRPRLYHFYETILAPQLYEALQAVHFSGPLGLDAFVYRAPDGTLQLKPVVELNPRYTMGRIAHELGQHNAARSVGRFQILTKSQLRQTGCASFAEWCRRLSEAHPVQLTTEASPRILRGSFPLCDPNTAQQFLALYHVRESIDAL